MDGGHHRLGCRRAAIPGRIIHLVSCSNFLYSVFDDKQLTFRPRGSRLRLREIRIRGQQGRERVNESSDNGFMSAKVSQIVPRSRVTYCPSLEVV